MSEMMVNPCFSSWEQLFVLSESKRDLDAKVSILSDSSGQWCEGTANKL